MRKILLGLMSVLLFALAVYMCIYGISIGGAEVSGVPTIQEENTILDNKIERATQLKNTDYPQSISSLEKAYKKLIAEKENYEQILALGVDENGLPLNKIQEYEIEKIWITMGNYAKKQGVDLKLDVTSNNSISGTYDLRFSVTGGYIQITDFLYDIERDNTLVFKLEQFKMVPSSQGTDKETSSDDLLATFVCKDIKLKITENNSTSTSQGTNNTEGNVNNSNNTATDNQNNSGGTSSNSGTSTNGNSTGNANS
ncbi:MAG: hypothetical protein HFJ55_00275 [Clostridia bacterium]|nr:hypothetical protein [Clostridia bacterium]